MPTLDKYPIFKNMPITRVSQKECLNNYVKFKHPKLTDKEMALFEFNFNNENIVYGSKEWKENYKKEIKKYKKIQKFKKKHNLHHRVHPIIEGYYVSTINKTSEKIIIPSHYKGQCHFYNNWCDIKYIPNDYIEVKLTKDELQNKKTNYACKKPSKKIINLEKSGLNLENWELSNKKHFITIKDILKLKEGDQIKVLVLDRNAEDIIEGEIFKNNLKANKIYKPEKFFSKNWAIYTHKKDLQGEIFYCWQKETLNKSIKSKSSIKSKKQTAGGKNSSSTFTTNNIHDISKPYPFEFHINYSGHNWFPLKNGYLPAKGDDGQPLLDGKKKKWTTFPKETPIGWRGPMILWDKLDKLPNVYRRL